MTASSISTYLDIAQAAGGWTLQESAATDIASMSRSAKVLASIFEGTGLATDLPEKTGLTFDQVLTALGALSESGLIELDKSDGTIVARLTDPVKTALGTA